MRCAFVGREIGSFNVKQMGFAVETEWGFGNRGENPVNILESRRVGDRRAPPSRNDSVKRDFNHRWEGDAGEISRPLVAGAAYTE